MSADRLAAYSYRTDPRVPPFDDATPLLIFDGKCVLCSRGVQWMLRRDPGGATRFAAIQEDISRALYAHYDLDAEEFDTFMVLKDGRPYLRWAGVLAAARTLPAPWKWLGQAGRLAPRFIGDALYDFVQRNRLAWFGARDACFAPTAKERRRFLAADGALT
ncbi:MAG: DCC1-like thiol-disulfide oxidoreductase family protein [Parvularculaceae bacterium]|nr:DCC1-like thiol-disulfide oxidoreductase family protein [Parvularculaceae bacterium]